MEILYTADGSDFANPERGFYVHILHGGDFSSANLNTYKAQNISLVLYQPYLTAFRTADISGAFLTEFQTNLDLIRNSGMKTILRFAYTSTDTNDATLTRIQGHLDQLAPYFAANDDIILGVQCGFVGQWGEFQGSANFGSDSWPPNLSTTNKANRKAVIDKALAVVPAHRFVQVRQPWIKIDGYGSTPAAAPARLGHFNDCFLSGPDDSGTYWQQASEETFLASDTRYTAMGGETCNFNPPRSSSATAMTEMARFHWSFINVGYNATVIQAWKDEGNYTTISKNLGYRLRLTSANLNTSVAPGQSFPVQFTIVNDGYAAPFAARVVKVVLRNTSTNAIYEYPLAVDWRLWLPGSNTVSESISIPSNLPVGSYAAYLYLPDPDSTLAADKRFCVRLANTGTWDSVTGYNNLNHTVSVAQAATPAERSMSKVWFDFGAAVNGNGNSPLTPKNTMVGHTWVGGDEHYFRRGTTVNGAFTFVAGTPGKKTKYKSWYNADGTDDMTKPKCTFNVSAVVSGYAGNHKDNCEVDSLRFVGNAIAVANDNCVIYIGNNSSIWNCEIDTNIGGIGAAGKSNVQIMYNTIAGVSHSTANGNNLIFATDSKDCDNVIILGNKLTFKGGGNAQSHCIRAGCDLQQYSMTNLLIAENTMAPPVGTAKTPNQYTHGIRLQRCPGVEVRHNNVKGMLTGIFMTGGGAKWGGWIHHNVFCDNWNFGIHAVTDMEGLLVEYNDCSRNGTDQENAVMHAYGRGIEFSGAAGQYRCGGHVVRFNVCNDNINYGGPLDNGSEGCGIGYDDGTWGCVAYGNILIGNEGNGVQYYGGPLGAGWTDTSNHCVGNYFENNCKASIKNRRTGGTFKTAFCAHIGMAATIGGTSIVANNVMVGGDCGVSQSSNCTNVVIANNIFQDVLNAVAFGHAAGYGCFNNLFYSKTTTVKKYATTALDANGTPTYPTLAYTGTADLTSNPMLDSQYRPAAGSPCIGAGYNIVEAFQDFSGKKFKTTPNIGMFENYLPTAPALIRL